jgi:hypothetical protein
MENKGCQENQNKMLLPMLQKQKIPRPATHVGSVAGAATAIQVTAYHSSGILYVVTDSFGNAPQ